MEPIDGFHIHSGWFIQRGSEGQVRLWHQAPGETTDTEATFDPDSWASMVASVSARGEDYGRFYEAQAFHAGDEDPEFKRLARHHLEAENIAAQMADLLRNLQALPTTDASMSTVIEDHLRRWDEHQTPAWPHWTKGRGGKDA